MEIFIALIIYISLLAAICNTAAKRNRLSKELYAQRIQNDRLARQVYEFQKKESDKVNCPFCEAQIRKGSVFCKFCGGYVFKHEEKERERNRKEFEEKGLDALQSDKKLMKQANEIRRIYGKKVYISYLKDKVKELGYGDVDLERYF